MGTRNATFRSAAHQRKVKKLLEALAFYADPDTYKGLRYYRIATCPLEEDLGGEVDEASYPGKKAREAIEEYTAPKEDQEEFAEIKDPWIPTIELRVRKANIHAGRTIAGVPQQIGVGTGVVVGVERKWVKGQLKEWRLLETVDE